MSDKKNIDRIFQERYKNFEPKPSDSVWDNIEESLHGKKKKRRIIPIWWQLGGVAAVLLLVLTLVGVFSASDEFPNNRIVNQNDKSESELKEEVKNINDVKIKSIKNNINDQLVDKGTYNLIQQPKTNGSGDKLSNGSSTTPQLNKEKASNSISELFNKTEEAITSTQINNKKRNNERALKDDIKSQNELDALLKQNNKSAVSETKSNSLFSNDSITKDPLLNSSILEENDIEKAIAESINDPENETLDKDEEKRKKWSVAPVIGPVYFNTLGDGSSIHSQFNSNAKSGDVNMSYGISGAYAINDKLKVRAGINKVDLGYSTDNVIAYSTLPTTAGSPTSSSNVQTSSFNQIDNIVFKNNTSNTAYLSGSIVSLDNAPEIIKTNPNTSLDQQFGFIEVPLEIEYKLVNKKLDVNLIGGFSTMFLNGNEIYEVSEGNRTLIGEATNINDVSYSANFGIGLNYGVSEKININLEPMFKYQINTFNNTSGDFQPYFIGVYTGLSFKF